MSEGHEEAEAKGLRGREGPLRGMEGDIAAMSQDVRAAMTAMQGFLKLLPPEMVEKRAGQVGRLLDFSEVALEDLEPEDLRGIGGALKAVVGKIQELIAKVKELAAEADVNKDEKVSFREWLALGLRWLAGKFAFAKKE